MRTYAVPVKDLAPEDVTVRGSDRDLLPTLNARVSDGGEFLGLAFTPTSGKACDEPMVALELRHPLGRLLMNSMSGCSSSSRHELFAQSVASGACAAEAYRQAGYSARGHAAEVNASKLLRKTEVSQRIAELQKENAERSLLTRDKALRILADVARGGTAAAVRERIRAIEILAKMNGWLAAVKTENKVSADDPLSQLLKRIRQREEQFSIRRGLHEQDRQSPPTPRLRRTDNHSSAEPGLDCAQQSYCPSQRTCAA